MRQFFLALALLGTLACGSKPASLRPAASWSATLALAGDAWLRNSVPRAYAFNTIDAATKELANTRAEVTDRGQQEQLDRAIRAAAALRNAVDANNRTDAIRAIAACDAAAKSLQGLSKASDS